MRSHQVALWAAVSAFCASMLAIGAIDLFDIHGLAEFIWSMFVAALTGGAVYAKQRLDDAKTGPEHTGSIVVSETEEKKMFSLELDKDPETLVEGDEVKFKVKKGPSG